MRELYIYLLVAMGLLFLTNSIKWRFSSHNSDSPKRHHRFRSIRKISQALLCAFLLLTASLAKGQEQPVFNCEAAVGYLFQGTPSTDAYVVNLATGEATLGKSALLGTTNAIMNAVGYNVKDNYLWAARIGTNEIVRIGSDWSVQTFPITGLPAANEFYVGDVSIDGVMYFYGPYATEIYRVDLDPASATYLQMLPTLTTEATNLTDWAFSPIDGNLYGMTNNENNEGSFHLYRFDPATGARTDLGVVSGGGIQAAANITFGASYMDSEGNLYVSNNETGNIYRIASPHTGGIVSTLVATGPLSSNNDGARCPSTPVIPPQPTFECEAAVGYLFQNAPSTDAYIVNLATGEATLGKAALLGTTNAQMNAIGYNAKDNYLWAVRIGTNEIVRIGSDWSVQTFPIEGLPAGVPFNVGDISADGILYLFHNGTGYNTIQRIDLDPASPTYLQRLSPLTTTASSIADWAFSPVDGNLYAISNVNYSLLRFNPETGARSALGVVTGGGIQAANEAPFGAAYMDSEGNLYVGSNGTGRIFQIASPHTGGITARVVAQGPISDNNDGARCPSTAIVGVPPTAVNDSTTTAADTPVTIPILANDSIGGSPLDSTSVKLIDPVSGDSVTTLTVAGEGAYTVDPATGTVIFTPETGFTGVTTPITYTVTDEAGIPSNPATIMVTVTAADLTTDLAIVKMGPVAVAPDSVITYTLLITNAGPGAADGAIVTDPEVANFTATSISCTAGSGAGGAAACPIDPTVAALQGSGLVIPTLPSGSSITLTITGTAGASGTITNVASIAAPTGVTDTNSANNTDTKETLISPDCIGAQTVYAFDPDATLAQGTAIVANGGTLNLIYILQSGTAIPSIGNTFTVPLTYSDFNQFYTGSDHTWSRFNTLTGGWNPGNPSFILVPNTTPLYQGLPATNIGQKPFSSTNSADNFFTSHIANGTLNQLGTFDINIGALPAIPAGVKLVSESIRILSTNNLSTNGNGFDQGGWWVKPIAQSSMFAGTTAQTNPLSVVHGKTYTYRYSAFTDNNQLPGDAGRGVIIDLGQIIFCTPAGPIALNDSTTTAAGTPVDILVLANDSIGSSPLDSASVRLIDPTSGDSVTTVTVTGEGAYAVDPATGTVTFTPEAGFTGVTTPITYTVADENGVPSNPATIKVTVTTSTPEWPVQTTDDPPQGSQFNCQTLYISRGASNILGLVNDADGNPLLSPIARYVGNVGSPNPAPTDGFGYWMGSLAIGTDPETGNQAAFGTTWGHGGQSGRPIYKMVSGEGTLKELTINDTAVKTPDLHPWGGLAYNSVDGMLYGIVNNSQQQNTDYIVFRMNLQTGVVEQKAVSLPGSTQALGSIMPDMFFDAAGAGYLGAKTTASGTNPWTLYRIDFTQTEWVGEPIINFTGLDSFNIYGAAYLNGFIYLGWSTGVIYKVPFERNLTGIELTTSYPHIADYSTNIETPPSGTPSIDGFAVSDLGSCALAPILGVPPTAANDSTTTNVGTPVIIPVLANDSIGDNPIDSTSVKLIDPVSGDSVTTVTVPNEGVYEVNPTTGAVTFTPEDGFTGATTPITYTVADVNGVPSNPATIIVTVLVVQPPFNCQVATGYLFQGTPTDAYVVNLATGETTLGKSALLGATNAGMNALGYNIKDNYLWAARTGTNEIVRIGSDWSVQTYPIVGMPASNSFNVGDINADGVMYFYQSRTTSIYRVDLDPASATYLQSLPTLTTTATSVSDWAFSPIDGNLYGMSDNIGQGAPFHLFRFDAATGVRTDLGVVSGGGIQAAANLAFGAAYMDNEGSLYLSNNDTGNIYRIVNPHTGSLTASLVATGPASGNNDGARCPTTAVVDVPPTAANDSTTTNVGTPVIIPVLANDSIGDNPIDSTSVKLIDPVSGNSVTTVTVPNEGTYVVDPTTGDVTFTPEDGFTGATTPITYTVSDENGVPSNPATIAVTVSNATFTLTKVVSGTVPDTVGGILHYNIVAVNTGDVVLSNIVVSDDNATITGGSPITTLAVGDSATVTAEHILTAVDLDSAKVINQAKAIGEDPSGNPTPEVPSDDPGTPEPGDPTETPLPATPPTAVSDSTNTTPGTPVTIPVLTNDTPGGSPLDPTSVQLIDPVSGDSVTTVTVPNEGTYVVDPTTGDVTFTPEDGFTGATTPITYTVSDENGVPSNPATIAVTVSKATFTLTKVVSGTVPDTVGGILHYNIVAVNTGDVVLSNIVVSDDNATITGGSPIATLAVGDSATVTAEHILTAADLDSAKVINQAKAIGEDPSGNPTPEVPSDDPSTPEPGDPTETPLTPATPPTAVSDSTSTTPGTPVVIPVLTNDTEGNSPLDPASVKLIDPVNGDSVTTVTVPNEGTYVVDPTTGDVTFTPEDGFTGATTPITYTVSDENGVPSNPATIAVTVSKATFTLTKVVSGTVPGTVGGILHYNIVAVNTGDVVLSNIVVSDDNATITGGSPIATLAVGDSATVTAEHILTAADLDSAKVINQAKAIGEDPSGNPTPEVPSDDPSTPEPNDPTETPLTPATPPTAVSDSTSTTPGTPVTIPVLTNDTPGGSPLDPTSVQLIDPVSGDSVTTVTVPNEGVYEVNPTTGAVTFTPEDGFTGATTPITYVVADENGVPSNPATVTVTVSNATFTLTKVVTGTVPDTVGGILHYNIVAVNTGDVVLSNIVVSDDNATITGGSPIATLAVGDSATVTAEHILTIADLDSAKVINQARAIGEDPSGNPTPEVPSDDPNTPEPNDPTETPLTPATPPTAVSDSTSTTPGTPVTIPVLTNDTPGGSPLDPASVKLIDPVSGDSVTTVTVPNEGTYVVDPTTGDVTFTPEDGFTGATTPITYVVADENGVPSNPATISVTVSNATFTLTKVVSGTVPDTVGGILHYNIVAVNTGNVALSNIVVSDDNATITGGSPIATLAVGDSATVTAEHILTIADLDSAKVINQARAIGEDPSGNPTPEVPSDDPNTPEPNDPTETPLTPATPPTAVSDSTSTTPNTPVTIPVLTNDTPGGSPLDPATVTITTPPTNGTVTVNPDGTVEYTPDPDFTGPDTFEYTVDDEEGNPSNPATVTVTVNSPTFTLTKVVTGTVPDTVGGILHYNIVAVNTGDVVLSNIVVSDDNATITGGSPIATLAVGDSATVTAEHILTAADLDSAKVINQARAIGEDPSGNPTPEVPSDDPNTPEPNDPTETPLTPATPPTAVNDSTSTTPGTPVTIPVLTNDTPGGSPLDPATVTITTPPTNGTVTVNPDGTVEYTPDPDFTGPDTFEYTVDDEEGNPSNPATVTVTVNSPTFTLTKVVTGTVPTTVGGVLHYNIVATNTGNLVLSNIVVSDDNATITGGSPIATLAVGDSATVTAEHILTAADLDSARVINQARAIGEDPSGNPTPEVPSDDPGTPEPNDPTETPLPVTPPTAVDDQTGTTPNTPVTIPVLENDSTGTNPIDPATVTITTPPTNGTVTVNPDGTVEYTPNPDFTGEDTFEYTVDDEEGNPSNPATVTVRVNEGPTAVDDTGETTPETPVVIPVLTNDTEGSSPLDPANVKLIDPVSGDSVTTVTVPNEGTYVVDPTTGAVTFTPEEGFTGATTPITYVVADENGVPSNPATITVTVNSPTFTLSKVVTGTVPNTVGGVLHYNIVATNTGNVVLSNIVVSDDNATITGGSPIASLAVGASATVTAEHILTAADLDSAKVINQAKAIGEDPSGNPTPEVPSDDPGTPEPNDPTETPLPVTPPTAVDDQTGTTPNTPVTIPVLDNDSTGTHPIDPATVTITTPPTNGTVTVNPDGTVEYTPNPDYTGPDEFEYTVDDEEGNPSNPATVTVRVNEGPTAVDDTAETAPETPVVIPVMTNDTEGNSPLDPTSVKLIDPVSGDSVTTVTVPNEGVYEVNPTTGAVTFTPEEGFTGATTPVTYTVSDENGVPSNPATITVTVNSPTFTLSKVVTGTVPNTVGGVLHYNIVATNTGNVVLSNIVVSDDNATITGGSPIASLAVGASATVTAEHILTAADLDSAKVINQAKAIGEDPSGNPTAEVPSDDPGTPEPNDPTETPLTPVTPPTAVDDSTSTNPGTPVTVPVLTNDTPGDSPIDPATVTITKPPTNGTVTVNPDGTVEYTPNPDYTGPDEFEYTVDDEEGNPSNPATVIVTVNEGPTAIDDSTSTNPGTPVTIPVLANDQEKNSPLDVTTVKLVDPLNSDLVNRVTIPNEGVYEVNPTTGGVTFTPEAGFTGIATPIQYRVEDQNGGLSNPATITVTVNDGPTAVDDSTNTNPGTPVTIPVLTNDTPGDSPIDPATVTITTPPTHGTVTVNPNGTVVYTPEPGYTGPDEFEYTVDDENGVPSNPATVVVTVNPPATPPTAVDDNTSTNPGTPVTIPVLTNDTPGDNPIDPSTVTITTPPTHGTVTVNPDGTVVYTPEPGYTGPDEFGYTVDDENGVPSNPATVVVTVNPPATPPTAVDDNTSTNPGTPVTIPVLTNDTPGGSPIDPATVTITTPPTYGTITVNPNGTVVYTPEPGYTGPDEFEYTVDDENGVPSNPAKVVVTVNPPIAPPTADDDETTTDGDTPVIIPILDNDTEGTSPIDPSKVKITNPPVHGTVEVKPDGTIVYTPEPGYTGPDEFEYTVDDANGVPSNPAKVKITVNAGPKAIDDEASTMLAVPVKISILNNDEPGSSPLAVGTVEVINAPQNGTATVNPDGTVTYTSNKGYLGTDRFTYRVKNERGLWTNVANVVIEVTANPLFIPNFFTPNGDGQNDVFEIVGIEAYDRVELFIFNRWGDEVYNNPNYINNWDGSNLNEGTYYYLVKLRKEGREETMKGWVLLKKQ